MTEYDETGLAKPGTYAIATVRIGGAKEDGTPIADTTAAVCDICGGWASEVCTSGTSTTTNNDFLNARVSRTLRVIVYACPQHYEQVLSALVDEYGYACSYACNRYDPDDLAVAVDESSSQNHQHSDNTTI